MARASNVARHLEMEIDLRGFGGSALTADMEVPKDRSEDAISQGIPITYVPARNTVFLSLALAWAETLGAFDIFIGVNCVDYSGYPDCRPEFLRAFEELANLATRAGVEGGGRFRIHAPLLTLDKPQIIERGLELGVDYSLTHSCYDPTEEGLSCGRMPSWLNQIEIYFSILQRKVLTPADALSLADLAANILAFEAGYQEMAAPFEWKFTRADLDALLNRLSVPLAA